MYHDNFILGQLLIAANQLTEIENDSCKVNEVQLHTCIYNLTTGEFQGLKAELTFIVFRTGKNESMVITKISLLFYDE